MPNRVFSVSAAALALLLAACGTEPSRTPSALEMDRATAEVDDGATLQLTAKVLDQNGKPFATVPAGAQISWTSAAPNTAQVDANGIVTGTYPGTARITATLVGTTTSASTDLVVRAVPAQVIVYDGDGQMALAGSTLTRKLVVRVLDRHRNPVGNAAVAFAATTGGGSFAPASASTGEAGLAEALWTLGAEPGENRAEARITGRDVAPATFSASGISRDLAPAIESLLPDTLRPGVVATLRGRNFSAVAGDNTVLVNGVLATVTAASKTELSVRLPAASAFPCEATRSVPVSIGVAGIQTARAHPLALVSARRLAVGEVLQLTAENTRCAQLDVTGSRYLVSVVNTSPTFTSAAAFQLRGATAGGAASAVRVPASPAPSLLGATAADPASDPHVRLMEQNRDILRRVSSRKRELVPTLNRASAAFGSSVPAEGDLVPLGIPNIDGSICSDAPKRVTARVVHVGPHSIVLEDTASAAAAKMDAQYRALGREFDETMYPILEENFGNPIATDPYTDNNGRVMMLFSPQVNNFAGGVIAFVAALDFFSASDTGCQSSNKGEIFYGQVPGKAWQTPDQWYRGIRSVLMHEVKHITSYAEHVLPYYAQRSGQLIFEESWLEEATAMAAMEIYGQRLFGYRGNGNTGYEASIGCEVATSRAGCADKPDALSLAFGWLNRYYDNTEERSPLDGRGGYAYGGGWQLLRWAADMSPLSDGEFFRAINLEKTRSGVLNLEARTGKPFERMITEWAVAAMLDDYPGFTPQRKEHSLPSWNTRDVFAGLNASNPQTYKRPFPIQARQATFGNFQMDIGKLAGGTAAFVELTGSSTAAQMLELRLSGGGAPSPLLRMSITRVQ